MSRVDQVRAAADRDSADIPPLSQQQADQVAALLAAARQPAAA